MTVREGEIVTLDGIGVCEIVSTADPSLVTVRVPAGSCIRIGEQAIERLRAASGPNDTPKEIEETKQ